MRAVVVNQAITSIEVVDHEKPALVAHGQALVKVEYYSPASSKSPPPCVCTS